MVNRDCTAAERMLASPISKPSHIAASSNPVLQIARVLKIRVIEIHVRKAATDETQIEHGK